VVLVAHVRMLLDSMEATVRVTHAHPLPQADAATHVLSNPLSTLLATSSAKQTDHAATATRHSHPHPT